SLHAALPIFRKRQRIGAVFLYSFPRPAHCDKSPATKGILCLRQFFVSNLVKKTTLSSGEEEPSGYWEGGRPYLCEVMGSYKGKIKQCVELLIITVLLYILGLLAYCSNTSSDLVN